MLLEGRRKTDFSIINFPKLLQFFKSSPYTAGMNMLTKHNVQLKR